MTNKIQTKLIVKKLISASKQDYLLAILIDSNNKPIEGVKIGFADDGVKYVKTDKDGKARYILNAKKEMGYTIKVAFFGDDKYQASEKIPVIIDKESTVLTVKKAVSASNQNYLLATLKDSSNKPIEGVKIGFADNGVKYVQTDKNGQARYMLSHLKDGKYTMKVAFFGNDDYKATKQIAFKFHIGKIATKLNVSGDKSYIYATLKDSDNVAIPNVNIGFANNGVTYVKTDGNGKSQYSISKFGEGSHTVKVGFLGNDDYKPSEKIEYKFKVEAEKPILYSYLTTQGCSGIGQCTDYYCACNSLQQCFYRLTGIHVSESTIASVAGTTTAGTGHWGIETAVAWFNRKYDKNIKIIWKNFSDIGWSGLADYMNKGAVFCHLLYRDQWGHYEVPQRLTDDNVIVLNSLGDSCGGGTRCGYIETRSKSTHRRYMGGISQKSVAILTI